MVESEKRIIHWKIFPNGCSVTADHYCHQLDRIAEKLEEKQDRIDFLHDNAGPYIAKSTSQKVLELGWTTVPHLPYSTDLASTDYHLYRFLSDHLREKKLNEQSDHRTNLLNLFDERPQDLYDRGIPTLPGALATSHR